jgi:predicted dehydrogenase
MKERGRTVTKYRVGIIGLGRIASTIDDEVQGHPTVALPYSHMACYREVDQVEVVAGADPFEQQRDDFAKRWGVENLYADYREMLEKERLDIVSVATSAKPRPGIVADVARSGVKAIFAEKPLATTLAEADDMVALCREQGVALAVGCTRRWDAWWGMARSIIASGQIGRVLQINAMGNAGISHNGSHLIDLIRYLNGNEPVEWVFGEAESDEAAISDDDLRMTGYLAFADGSRCFLRTWPSGAASEWTVDIAGETGTLRATANGGDIEWWQAVEKGAVAHRPIPRPQRILSPGVNAVHDIIAAIDTGKKPECAGEDGVAALEIAIALRESHRLGGRRVDLPLADRSLGIRSAETLRGDLPVRLRTT